MDMRKFSGLNIKSLARLMAGSKVPPGELCPILDIKQNGWLFEGTKINPQFLLSVLSNIDMTLLFYITNIWT